MSRNNNFWEMVTARNPRKYLPNIIYIVDMFIIATSIDGLLSWLLDVLPSTLLVCQCFVDPCWCTLLLERDKQETGRKMPVSTAALKQIAACGAIVSIGGAAYFYKRIQDNVTSGSYYSKSVEILSKHKGATDVLGLPIKTKFVNLGDTFNVVSALQANLAIPVRGSVRAGVLHTWSSRESIQEDWTVQRIDLEVTNPKRKVTIYAARSHEQTEQVEPADSPLELTDR